uniref:Integrase catalytic domain-containing protein n=1 Tax=Tanacetum cinerariifolium TaxID=118510 RepID=A0A6L2MCP0_TANCI|nr:hypothetical protein [Tanacetum cinerariifolium]
MKLQDKAIVCPKNDTTNIINNKILSLLPGRAYTYISYDEAIPHGHDGGGVELLYRREYLNTLSFPGLPPHRLELKIGTPIMLLHNIAIAEAGKELGITSLSGQTPTSIHQLSRRPVEVAQSFNFSAVTTLSRTWCMPNYQSRKEMTGNNGGKDGQITLHYPMLSRTNYAAWAIKMRVFMQAQGVWEVVEPRTTNMVVEKSAKEPWEALKTMFMRAYRVKTARIQTLKAEFESLNMKETEGVDEFAVKVSNIVSTMRALGDTVKECYVVKKLLRAVPSKFLQIASTLEQFGDLDMMRAEEVIRRLKAHEERMKGYVDLEAHEAEAEKEVVIMVVVVVVEVDHTIKEKEVKVRLAVKIRAGYSAIIAKSVDIMQLRTHGDATNESHVWYLDIGASNHMTGDKYKFKNLNEMVQGYMKFGNEIKVRIKGKGSIVFQCKNGEQQKLDEVYYIPDLCSNIISLGQLAVGGDEIKIKDPFLWVYNGTGKLLMKVHRMGHVNFNSLKFMFDKSLIEGMPKMYTQTLPCEGCLTKDEALDVFKNFKRKVEVETGEKLKVLRTDRGDVFKNFKRKVEVETGEKLKVLRIDRGGDFLSNQFTTNCNETGLERHFTSPYSSQQNRVVERRNRTVVEMEPVTYTEASKRGKWVKSMDSKLASIEKNNAWKLVDLPKNQNPIGLKWVYKVKRDPNGKIVKYKAIIMAKGYVQKHGIDYKEVFAPVAKIETVHLILALTGSYGWWVHHLDVKSAFLNVDLEEEVYVSQQEGYQKEGESNKVYKISKALYGLKQAPRAWNACLDQYLKSLGFVRCAHEYSVYTKKEKGDILILGDMNTKFEMSNLVLLTFYLGIEVSQLEDGITLKQEAYAKNLLIKTRMLDCNPTKNPMEHKLKLLKEEGKPVNPTEYRSIAGGLRYLTHTRPYISFAVRFVSRFMEKPTVKHLQAMKRILSDLANDVNDKKSTGGMAFYLNVAHVCGKEQKADILTKPLARVKHEKMRNLMGIKKVMVWDGCFPALPV